MHYDDAALLAYLEGEQAEAEEFEMLRHLEACRRCRDRVTMLQRQIADLPAAVGSAVAVPHSRWTQEARERLNFRLRAVEAELAAGPRGAAVRRRVWQAGAIAASIAACAMVLWLRQADRSGELANLQRTAVQREVARAVQAERVLSKAPVQQSFAVEIAELRPQRRVRNAKLEVWSDQPSKRYASRFTGDGGELRHAVWRPGSGETDYLYRPEGSEGVVSRRLPPAKLMPLESLAELGLDANRIEKAFLRWLDHSAGQPVSFTSDLATWSQDDGGVFRAERIDGGVRVSARRTIRGMTMHLLVDLDAGSYQPRLQSIRFETADRAIEFRLATKSIRNVAAAELSASLFHPEGELALGAPDGVVAAAKTVEDPESDPVAVPEGAVSAGMVPVAADWMRAFYQLHRAGASVGGAVRIEPGEHGVLIQGLYTAAAEEETRPLTVDAPLEVVLDAFASMRESGTATEDLRLRHAEALQRLARQFPVEKTRMMNADQLNMLDTMIRDHTGALQRGVASDLATTAKRGTPAVDWRVASDRVAEALRLGTGEGIAAGIAAVTRGFEHEKRSLLQ